jgi:hypothetical protein
MSARERDRQKKIKEFVIKRDGLVCCYCDKLLTIENATMEHIVPDSKRGTFNTTNLTVSCYTCNNNRGNKPFFEYIKQFHFDDQKLLKYKRMYFNNLKIKILNIAKEEFLKEEQAIPKDLIHNACTVLKIKDIDFSQYEKWLEMELTVTANRKRIKFSFEKLIRILEAESS